MIKDYDWHLLDPNQDLQISIQLEDGSVVNMEKFCHAYDDMSMKISGTLHIATWTFPVRVGRSREFSSTLEYEAVVELEDKGPSIWSFAPTCTTPILPDTNCTGIHLYHTTEGEPYRRLHVLVIQEVESGVYERVGYGEMGGDMKTVSKDRRLRPGNLDDTPSPIMSFWRPLPTPKKVWKEFQLR